MKVAYVRVSPAEQNEARQIEALKKHSIEKWFTEKISGKSMDRPQLQSMLDYVREGDTVYIHDFSRLARSTKDLLEIVERLQAKGVHLVSNKENLDTGTPTGKLMLTMIAAINEFERQICWTASVKVSPSPSGMGSIRDAKRLPCPITLLCCMPGTPAGN